MKFRKTFLKLSNDILEDINLTGVLTTEDEVLSFLDVTPIQIDLNGHDAPTWTHPELDEIFELDEENCNAGEWDSNVHRMWIDAEGVKGFLHVVFKAPALTLIEERLGLYSCEKESEDERLSQGLYQYIFENVLIALTEDTWSPGGEQFCFTDFGQKINTFLSNKQLTYRISPDIAMERGLDSSNKYEYCWSS